MPKNFLLDLANQEFKELLKRSKWTQSEAARQLKVSPGLVSQYLSGLTRPSPRALAHFRLLLEEKSPPPLNPVPFELRDSYSPSPAPEVLKESHEKLSELAQADPQKFETVHQVIKLAHSHLAKKKPTKRRS